MLYNGLIIDIGKYSVIVMASDNAYYKLSRKPDMYIGQEVLFKQSDIINTMYFSKRIFAVAACLLLIIGVALYFNFVNKKDINSSQEFAYVSLDINPSMEFAIDENEHILKVENLNDDAAKISKSINLKGMELSKSIPEIIKRCEENGVITTSTKSYFLISGSINIDSKEVQSNKIYAESKLTKVLDTLKNDIRTSVKGEQETLVIKSDMDVRKLSRENNISLGKCALFSELNRLGRKISLEELKNDKISDLIKLYNDTKASSVTQTPVSTNAPVSTNTPALTDAEVSTNTQDSTGVSDPASSSNQNETGTGLYAEYYDNIDLTNFKMMRLDPAVNFNWGSGSPDPQITNDESYSVRWTGQIKPVYSEKYTLYITRDNGVRLWIDNKLVIDKWDSYWGVEEKGTIELTGGHKYNIRIEYFNNGGTGNIKLEWSSKSTKRSVVPKECLYPSKPPSAEENVVFGNGSGLSSEYYDNNNLTNLKIRGIDPTINFNWGIASPNKAIQIDQKFSICWTGQIQPVYSEDYIFYLTHDDGVKLWLDGKLVINKWVNGSSMTQSGKIPLKANKKYNIKLEYFNGGLDGLVKMEWSSTSTKRCIVPQSCLYPAN
ncbi:MAG TPA: PA14 domain-containing protein [Clostridia bacterium]